MAETALSIGRLEGVLVADFDADETVGEVGIGHGPVLKGPSLVSKDNLHHEHIRDGISDSLVNKIADGREGLESVLLRRRLGLLLTESTDSLLGEDNSAVTVGLEVDTNVELAGSMVQMLDTSGSADDWELKVLLDVAGAGTVGISSLDDANAEIILEASRANEVANERGIEGRDAVAIEHEEASVRVNPIVDQSVCVTVE